MIKKSILFLGKKNDACVEKAIAVCVSNFERVDVHLSDWNNDLPKDVLKWKGDYIISYLSRWVVPESVLKKARIAAINFHPAPSEYPGVGCLNFALYERVKGYGVTCHHMSPKVDTGDIIAIDRFQIYESDNVSTLLAKAHDHLIILFYKIMNLIIDGKKLPIAQDKWGRKPLTWKELNELREIKPDMSREEVLRRIHATLFNEWKPFIKLYGFNFELNN